MASDSQGQWPSLIFSGGLAVVAAAGTGYLLGSRWAHHAAAAPSAAAPAVQQSKPVACTVCDVNRKRCQALEAELAETLQVSKSSKGLEEGKQLAEDQARQHKAMLESQKRDMRRLQVELESWRRRAESAEETCSMKDAEVGALRSQTMKLAVDVGKLQARLIHATSAAEASPSSLNSFSATIRSRGSNTPPASTTASPTMARPAGAAPPAGTSSPNARPVGGPLIGKFNAAQEKAAPPSPSKSIPDDDSVCESEVSVAASEKLQANRAKFNKMKAQRNAYKERLAEAVAELAKTRQVLTILQQKDKENGAFL